MLYRYRHCKCDMVYLFCIYYENQPRYEVVVFVVVYVFLVMYFNNSTGFIHYAYFMVMFTDKFYMKG